MGQILPFLKYFLIIQTTVYHTPPERDVLETHAKVGEFMLNRFVEDTEHVYLAIGSTDFRKQTSSLASLVQLQFGLDPFKESAIFIFCNKKRDSIKLLKYDRNGFIPAHKKLQEKMKFQ